MSEVATGGRRPIRGGLKWLVQAGCLLVGTIPGTARAQEPAFAPSGLGAPAASEALDAANLSPVEAVAAMRAQGMSDLEIRNLVEGSPDLLSDVNVDVPNQPSADRVETAPDEIIEETPAKAAAEDDEKLVPFGYSLFENSPESYRQPAIGPVDPGYPLGPGDTIVLDVWGDTVFRVERELDREGGVNLPDVGRVVLVGMTLDEVRGTLQRRLARVYSGLEGEDASTYLSVTLGNLRVIRVFTVGRARRPGGYDLSAASTVFHGLFFSGGPTEGGSLRDIRLIRDGREVARLDVYEYLRTGRRGGDIRLENDDTIFIPPSGPRVSIRGQVRQDGIYEMLPGETLADLVEMTGGFTERSYSGRIQIDRILTAEEQEGSLEDRKILDLAWEEAKTMPMRDGDVVQVFEIEDRVRNFVMLQGEVRRPGRYELGEEDRLSDLIEKAGGLLETAVLERAEVVRTYEDQSREQIAVDLAAVARGDLQQDLRLMPRDAVRIHSIWQLNDREHVVIHGAVRSPGRYELRDNMTLRDLLLQAGGLKENAYREAAEVSRVRPDRQTELEAAEIFRVPLGEEYLVGEGPDLRLEPWDNVFVRGIPDWELQRNVTVTGEVRFPGVYTLVSHVETLAELIERAGGLSRTAYPEGATMFREKDAIGRIALDLEHALTNRNSNDNLVLFDGDSLHVPEEPKTVTVAGSVGWPTSLVYQSGWSIGDYVTRAGGTTELADRGQIRVIYSTGAARQVKKFWFDPEVRPGSTILVPPKPENAGIAWGDVIRDSASVLASLATVALLVDRAGR